MTADAMPAADVRPKAKIFISYSRKDVAFADRIEAALKARGFEPLIDRSEIYAFEDWWKRIEALIGRADTVVFVLSPDAVASEVALKEVAHAASMNKRFAPIVCRRTDDSAVPEALRRLNFIFFDDPADFEVSADRLAEALRTDIGWVRQHTEYGEVARRWVSGGRPGGLLLRSPALEEAERWIASRPQSAPEPTADTQAFVAESRKGATKRRNILTGSLAAGLIVALVLAGLAFWQRQVAVQERQIADQQRKRAEDTLAAATTTANSLVRDLAVRFRGHASIPSTLIKDILDRARKLQEQLISEGEDSPELRRSQSRALNETAATLNDIGEFGEALATAQQAKSILQRLIAAQPDIVEFQRALASSDQEIGDALRGLSRLDESLAGYSDGRAILQTLVAKDQGNSQLQEELANVDDDIAAALGSEGNFQDAIAASSAGLTIRKQLATSDPSNVEYQIDVAGSYVNIGYSLARQGKQDDAAAALRQALTSAQAVVAKQPDNTDAQRLLLTVEQNLGKMSAEWGNYAAALQYCGDAIATADRLVQGDPLNFNWQGTLEECHLTVGEIQSSQNHFADALSSYKDAQARADHMLASDSGSIIWQRYLLTSTEGSGNAQIGLRDFAGAEKSYTDAAALIQKMLKEAATDLDLQYKLATTHQMLAQVYTTTRRPTDALNALRQAQTIMVRLTTLAPNNAEWKSDLDAVEARIASRQK
jgi:tetratricopeptide (TPR) repeat protein